MQHLLGLRQRPTAVFACNDLMAFGAISAAASAGLALSGNLSLIGFDDIVLAAYSSPPLTTVAQPKHRMGALAASLLLARIGDRRLAASAAARDPAARSVPAPIHGARCACARAWCAMTKMIVVVGSVNIDLMLRCTRLPRPGETVLGEGFCTEPGGKGANRAVAAARLGAPVALIGCVGDDTFGTRAIAGLRAEGVDLTHLSVVGGCATVWPWCKWTTVARTPSCSARVPTVR